MKAALVDAWKYGRWISLSASEKGIFSAIPTDCQNLISKVFFSLEPYTTKIDEYSYYQ